jgi:hypothetical protein
VLFGAAALGTYDEAVESLARDGTSDLGASA